MSDRKKITNYGDNIALDGFDYPDDAVTHVTDVDTNRLIRTLEIIDTLGWDQISVYAIQDWTHNAEPNDMVSFQPVGTNLFDKEQAAITLAPLRRGEDD